MNTVIAAGFIKTPEKSHIIKEETIYKSELYVPRNSGTVDTIPLLMPEYLIPATNEVALKGEFRSHNTPDRHLMLYVYVTEIQEALDAHNEVTLTGYICKKPVCRRTPKGRLITDLLIAVPRSNVSDRSDYIPVIMWKDVSELNIGDLVTVEGRIQSRKYNKGVAYEVSGNTICCK